MALETSIETYLNAEVRSMGGWSIKFAPTAVGLPDRLVLLPGGKAHLVELKAPRGRLARAQRVVHRRLGDMGHPVVVLASVEQVDEWVRRVRD